MAADRVEGTARLALALAALDRAGIAWCLLREPAGRAAPAGDVDVLVARGALPAVRRALVPLGFARRPVWNRAEAFFLAYDRSTDQWTSLRVIAEMSPHKGSKDRESVTSAADWKSRGHWAGRFREWRGFGSLDLRQRGLTVALLGPDGVGKSALAMSLVRSVPMPVRCVYMGLGAARVPRLVRLPVPGLRPLLYVLVLWTRYLIARYHRARGRLVIFDRYTYDAFRPLDHNGRVPRAQRWIWFHLCPEPDLVMVLDAPGETVYARKGESSPERLEADRQAFLALRGRLRHVAVVDAARTQDEVRAEVADRIWQEFKARWAVS